MPAIAQYVPERRFIALSDRRLQPWTTSLNSPVTRDFQPTHESEGSRQVTWLSQGVWNLMRRDGRCRGANESHDQSIA